MSTHEGVTTAQDATIRILKDKIATDIKEYGTLGRRTIHQANEVGQSLLKLKEMTKGHFHAELEEMKVNRKTAWRMMRVAMNWDRVSQLETLHEALVFLCHDPDASSTTGNGKKNPKAKEDTFPADWPERLRPAWCDSEVYKKKQLALRKDFTAMRRLQTLPIDTVKLHELRTFADFLDQFIIEGVCAACDGRLPDDDVVDAIPCCDCDNRGYVTVAEFRTGKVSTREQRQESQACLIPD